MTRGGVLLAVALTLAIAPAAAAGQAPQQPDLMFVSRGGAVVTGDGTYTGSGVGQQRSIIVDKRTVLVLRVENDGESPDRFVVGGRVFLRNQGFTTRYFSSGRDITSDVRRQAFYLQLDPGESKHLRVVITVDPNAPLGLMDTIGIWARSASDLRVNDYLFARATKTSTPPSTLTAV